MKNYSRIVLLAVSMTLLSGGLFAQGLYVGITAGYALKAGSESDFSYISQSKVETINYSLGKGFDAGIVLGYMFNDRIGIDLGASYLIGGKTTFNTDIDSDGTDETIIKGSMIRVIPSIVVAAGLEKINPYAKLGVIIGFAGSVTTEITSKESDIVKSTMATTIFEKYKDKGGVAFGVNGALGADFNMSEKLAIFAEINVESLSYSPTKGELTEFTVNGSDRLSGLETFQKEFVYEKELDLDEPFDAAQPTKQLKYKEPFGSVGLNVGVKIKL